MNCRGNWLKCTTRDGIYTARDKRQIHTVLWATVRAAIRCVVSSPPSLPRTPPSYRRRRRRLARPFLLLCTVSRVTAAAQRCMPRFRADSVSVGGLWGGHTRNLSPERRRRALETVIINTRTFGSSARAAAAARLSGYNNVHYLLIPSPSHRPRR